jgi:hypothetical protein
VDRSLEESWLRGQTLTLLPTKELLLFKVTNLQLKIDASNEDIDLILEQE